VQLDRAGNAQRGPGELYEPGMFYGLHVDAAKRWQPTTFGFRMISSVVISPIDLSAPQWRRKQEPAARGSEPREATRTAATQTREARCTEIPAKPRETPKIVRIVELARTWQALLVAIRHN
jgi:hypothetical protein